MRLREYLSAVLPMRSAKAAAYRKQYTAAMNSAQPTRCTSMALASENNSRIAGALTRGRKYAIRFSRWTERRSIALTLAFALNGFTPNPIVRNALDIAFLTLAILSLVGFGILLYEYLVRRNSIRAKGAQSNITQPSQAGGRLNRPWQSSE